MQDPNKIVPGMDLDPADPMDTAGQAANDAASTSELRDRAEKAEAAAQEHRDATGPERRNEVDGNVQCRLLVPDCPTRSAPTRNPRSSQRAINARGGGRTCPADRPQ